MNEQRDGAWERSVTRALIGAARRVEQRYDEAFAAVDLTAARYGVLEQLVDADEPLLLGDLASRLACVRSNMTQLIDRLEAEGLVQRVSDPADRRCVRAALTEPGRERAKAGAVQLRRVRRDLEESLPEAERERMLRALEGMGVRAADRAGRS